MRVHICIAKTPSKERKVRNLQGPYKQCAHALIIDPASSLQCQKTLQKLIDWSSSTSLVCLLFDPYIILCIMSKFPVRYHLRALFHKRILFKNAARNQNVDSSCVKTLWLCFSPQACIGTCQDTEEIICTFHCMKRN